MIDHKSPQDRKIANDVDLILQKKLTKKEYNKLFTLVRSMHTWSRDTFKSRKKLIADPNVKSPLNVKISKQLSIAKKIISYYDKAGINDNNWVIHWDVMRNDQLLCHEKYESNSRPPRQDNKTYINKGNGCPHSNKIRYPRKKRKTAWKRFYRLFPHLNPENNNNKNKYKYD